MVELEEDPSPTETLLSEFKTFVIGLGIEMQWLALHETSRGTF